MDNTNHKTRRFDVTSTHIAQTNQKLGGRPYIVGTDIRVQDIYIEYEYIGKNPDEIATEHQIELVQVFAALTFCYDHRDYIERIIVHDRKIGHTAKSNSAELPDQRHHLSG